MKHGRTTSDSEYRVISDYLCIVVLLIIGVLAVTHAVPWDDLKISFIGIIGYLLRSLETAENRLQCERLTDNERGDNNDNDNNSISNPR